MIHRIWPAFALAFLILLPAQGLRAQPSDPAAAAIQNFYDALTASMKSGGTIKSRYDKLKPAIDRAFDIAGMTALSVGPTWSSISASDQKDLTDAFDRMTVADYARNFDNYNGEKFTVDPAVIDRGEEKFVKSTLTPAKGAPVPFNYRMRDVNGEWKIVDIYLNGNISQLAQKRSDFSATLQASGPEGLAKKINELADQSLG